MSEPCILIVEDNEANLHLMKEVLKPLGFTILVANDGEEGVRMARENLPDLIVMDIQLPKMDGLTAQRPPPGQDGSTRSRNPSKTPSREREPRPSVRSRAR